MCLGLYTTKGQARSAACICDQHSHCRHGRRYKLISSFSCSGICPALFCTLREHSFITDRTLFTQSEILQTVLLLISYAKTSKSTEFWRERPRAASLADGCIRKRYKGSSVPKEEAHKSQ